MDDEPSWFQHLVWRDADDSARIGANDHISFQQLHLLYEGPDNADGWIVGSHNPDSWTFHDGAFASSSPGSLGRDFNLSESSTIEFDLAWSDAFELLVSIYSDAVDQLEYGNSYMLEFRRDSVNNQVSLRHIDMNRQTPIRNFGSAPLPDPGGKNKVRVTIQSNKDEGTVAVFVDNVLVKRWKDDNGFSATGGGLLFQQMGGANTEVRLSNFRISQWQGRYEPETSVITTNVDVIRFINHDQASGKITAIKDGKVALALGDTVLHIPIQRVTQINFAAAPAVAATRVRGKCAPGFRLAAIFPFNWKNGRTGRFRVGAPFSARWLFSRGKSVNWNLILTTPNRPLPWLATRNLKGSMNKITRLLPCRALFVLAVALSSGAAPATNAPADSLIFRNGDLLYGNLLAIDAPSTVQWQHPDAVQPIDFKQNSIAEIDFPESAHSAAPSNNACRLVLADGDSLEGNLISCDHSALVLQNVVCRSA